jgi:hypothetical protein
MQDSGFPNKVPERFKILELHSDAMIEIASNCVLFPTCFGISIVRDLTVCQADTTPRVKTRSVGFSRQPRIYSKLSPIEQPSSIKACSENAYWMHRRASVWRKSPLTRGRWALPPLLFESDLGCCPHLYRFLLRRCFRASFTRQAVRNGNGVTQINCCLQKISQPCDFGDVLTRQDGPNQFTLRSGMYLVQVMLACGFRHKLPNALVQSALGD